MGNRGKVINNSTYLERYKKLDVEEKNLLRQFDSLSAKHKNVVGGLIKRAAFVRVLLEGLEEDIKTNGEFELFTQSDMVEPYQRKRPSVDIYNTMIKNYASIIKQLTDLLPPEEAKQNDDGFEGFVEGGK